MASMRTEKIIFKD